MYVVLNNTLKADYKSAGVSGIKEYHETLRNRYRINHC